MLAQNKELTEEALAYNSKELCGFYLIGSATYFWQILFDAS